MRADLLEGEGDGEGEGFDLVVGQVRGSGTKPFCDGAHETLKFEAVSRR